MYNYENVKIGDSDIQIVDSYKLSKKDIKILIDNLIHDYPENDVIKHRTRYSILSEIYVHNFCYKLNILRERTGSVDINYPINKVGELIYKIIGPICSIFIK